MNLLQSELKKGAITWTAAAKRLKTSLQTRKSVSRDTAHTVTVVNKMAFQHSAQSLGIQHIRIQPTPTSLIMYQLDSVEYPHAPTTQKSRKDTLSLASLYHGLMQQYFYEELLTT